MSTQQKNRTLEPTARQPRVRVCLVLMGLALATLVSCSPRPPQNTVSLAQQFDDQGPRTISPSDAADIVKLAEGLTTGSIGHLRARRRAVLSLWIKGERVDHIAAKTGYEIHNVIETIENYEKATENHSAQIYKMVYSPQTN